MAVFSQKRQQARQEQRSTRQGVRQSKRADRQKARQQARTQRVQARQTSKQYKEMAKAQGGFYSPEGQQAKWTGIQSTVGVGTDAAGRVAAGIATGGASEAGGGIFDRLGGLIGGEPVSGNGSSVMMQDSYTGEFLPEPVSATPWYSDPDNQKLLVGGLVVAGAAAWWMNKPKKKK